MASIVIGIDVGGRLHNIEAQFKNLNNRHVYTSIYLHNFEKQQIQLKLLGINITYAMSPVNEQDTSGANAMMSMARGELINTVNSTGRSNSSSSGKSASRQSRGGMARGGGGRDESRRINERNGERTDVLMRPEQLQYRIEQMGPVVAIGIMLTDHVRLGAQEVTRIRHQQVVPSIMKIMNHT